MRLVAICTGEAPEAIAERIGDGGGGKLKALLTEALNANLARYPGATRALRRTTLRMSGRVAQGRRAAREEGVATLKQVRKAMNMDHGLD